MPKPIDLTGRKYGELLVVELVKYQQFAKDSRGSIWLIECQRCGRRENLHQYLIPYTAKSKNNPRVRWCCTVCTRGPCEICGNEIVTDDYRGVCSPQCAHERLKKQQREHYYRLVENDPDHNKKTYQRKISDEAGLERQREYNRVHNQRRKERRHRDPEYREHLNAIARADYWRNREARLARRKELFDQLSPEEQIAVTLARRAANRDYYWENRERIMTEREAQREQMTESELEQRRRRSRALARRAKAQENLQDLRKIGGILNDKRS